MNDICVRAVKTFVQAFLAIFIPELVLIINNAAWSELAWPAVLFTPLFCSSLAAALSATWNLLEAWFKSEDSEDSEDAEIEEISYDVPVSSYSNVTDFLDESDLE